MYLDVVSQWKFFYSTVLFADRVSGSQVKPCLLSIREDGVAVLDCETHEVVEDVPYHTLRNFGGSAGE